MPTPSDPTFSTLELTGPHWKSSTELNGQPWDAWSWDSPYSRQLQRVVSAGVATIRERTDGKYAVEINLPDVVRAQIAHLAIFDSLRSAAEGAETFAWETIEHAGKSWYVTGDRQWTCYLGEGDIAVVSQYSSGDGVTFYMKRQISPRPGVSYEMTANHYDVTDHNHAVRTFAEAAAIALTMPAYLSVLAAKE